MIRKNNFENNPTRAEKRDAKRQKAKEQRQDNRTSVRLIARLSKPK
ncbi:MAG: hypothetical protein PHR51_00845 [Patescibacteria group bacterium]|nr:hypothetical protein [Patescibacteria group bacterium]